jgi:hypothetical protein
VRTQLYRQRPEAIISGRRIKLLDQLKQMAVGIVEIDATTAVPRVDLAESRPINLGVEVDSSAVDTREGRIEFHIAEEEGALEGPAGVAL